MHRLRALTAALAILALVALPAGAQTTPEEYISTAGYTGVDLRLPGAGEFLKLAIADAGVDTTPDPTAAANATGIDGSDDSVSTAEAKTKGDAVRDPETGDNCATPALPDPVGQLVDFGLACSTAEASVLDGRPASKATAVIGSLSINGSFLADALIDLILAPLSEQLQPAIDAIEEQVLTPVTEAVAEACNEVAAQVGQNIPLDPADILPDQVQDAIDALPVDSEEPCAILLQLITAPPGVGPLGDITERIQDILREALSGLDLVAIDLGGGDVSVQTTEGQVIATTTGSALTIDLPSLAFLTDILNEVVEEILGEFLDAVEDVVAPIAEAVEAIPVLGPLVANLLGDLSLPLLDDEPLLSLSLAATEAEAIFDRASGKSSATGNPGTIVVTLNSTLAELLNTDAEIRVAAGQSQTFGEGTPLESSFSVGDASTSDEAVEGLPGQSVTVSGLRIELFTGLEGGVVLDVASSRAAAHGTPGTRVDTPSSNPPLPTTGGGIAAVALAVALGAAALRRRG